MQTASHTLRICPITLPDLGNGKDFQYTRCNILLLKFSFSFRGLGVWLTITLTKQRLHAARSSLSSKGNYGAGRTAQPRPRDTPARVWQPALGGGVGDMSSVDTDDLCSGKPSARGCCSFCIIGVTSHPRVSAATVPPPMATESYQYWLFVTWKTVSVTRYKCLVWHIILTQILVYLELRYTLNKYRICCE